MGSFYVNYLWSREEETRSEQGIYMYLTKHIRHIGKTKRNQRGAKSGRIILSEI